MTKDSPGGVQVDLRLRPVHGYHPLKQGVYSMDSNVPASPVPSAGPVAAPAAPVAMTAIPSVVIVGADKGGVGKSTVARTLLDYFLARAIPFRAFDTEPAGGLQRFFPNQVQIVDITDSDGQMALFDGLSPAAVTVVDIRGGHLLSTLAMLNEIGFIDPAKCRLTVLHVLGPNQQSASEIQAVTSAIAASRYIPVANHINDTKFGFPAGSLEIGKLTERAAEDVDQLGVPFSLYDQRGQSGVLRGYVKSWIGRVFASYDAAKIV